MEIKRLSIVVHGRVQGVGFRYFVRDIAQRMNLSGWVRNLFDGGVEMEAQGDPSKLELFKKEIHEGPPLAFVKELKVVEIPDEKDEKMFVIRH
jgi:acylphosphatase